MVFRAESRCSYNSGGATNKRQQVCVCCCRWSPLSVSALMIGSTWPNLSCFCGIHVRSRSFCQRLSKHFRSGKLFLSQKARRLESQKACYGGILYVFLLSTGERFSARPDDNMGNLTRDSHLLQPSYIPDLLPLYCWCLLQGFFYHIYSSSHHHHVASCATHERKGQGSCHDSTGLVWEGRGREIVDCADVSRAEHEALIREPM